MSFNFSIWFLGFAVSMVLLNFVLYPGLLFVAQFFYHRKGQQALAEDKKPEFVSFIIVAHNAEQLIVDKINNILQLHSGRVRYEIIIYLDGCTDKTLEKVEAIVSDKLRIINEPCHLGKITGLNKAVQVAQGEVLIFTDVDALFDKDILDIILEPFKNPQCGGVCGQRIIREKQQQLNIAQQLYIDVDSYIKKLESYFGNITSNDGKLYAVRRRLFQPIADAVTDDLFSCLNIAEQSYHFVFEPRAKAYIPAPSRHTQHEYSRRKRIITRSLNGIFLHRRLLNPFHYGLFALGLLINKVFRRMLGSILLLSLVSSYFASSYSVWIMAFFYLQFAFYLIAIAYPLLLSRLDWKRGQIIIHIASICWYFCLGNVATLAGVINFLSGKRVSKWVPQKHD